MCLDAFSKTTSAAWRYFLKENRVSDTFEFVEKALASLRQEDPLEDLKARRIVGFVGESGHRSGYGRLDIYKNKQNFFVCISDEDSIDEWIRVLGHELGHTFVYGSIVIPPIKDPLILKTSPEEEIFCELFSREWEKIHRNHDKLRLRLMRVKERTR